MYGAGDRTLVNFIQSFRCGTKKDAARFVFARRGGGVKACGEIDLYSVAAELSMVNSSVDK